MSHITTAAAPGTLAVIEARFAAGVLADHPANGALTGRKWRVRIFEYGLSRNRYPVPGAPLAFGLPLRWTEQAARAALPHLDGAPCFADHSADTPPGDAPPRSVRDLVGFFSAPALGPRGPEATLTLLESEGWARTKLLAAWRAGRPALIGFSVDAVIGVRPSGAGPLRALEVETVSAIHSVDMVSAASSGGRVLDVIESAAASGTPRERFVVYPMPLRSRERDTESIHTKGATMRQEIEALIERLRSAEGGAALRLRELLEAELASAEPDPARALAALADWLTSEGEDAELSPTVAAVQERLRSFERRVSETAWRQRAAEGRLLLEEKLTGSRLPQPLARLVASRFLPEGPFRGRPVSEQEIDAEIHRVREAYAAVSPAGRVVEGARARVLLEPSDKMQTALDRLLGLPVENRSAPAFRGIREAYVAYTGDDEISGTVSSRLSIREEFNTAGFPNALANTLRRLLLADYREQDYGIGLIAQFSSVPDFRTQERVRLGYFGDLPEVDPEVVDYDELTAPTDEKASFSVATFGGLVTVTRKMIVNDDLSAVPKIVGRLGRSAHRTLAQRVFNLMINNAAIYDGVAWFHATHGNLGSTALSAAEIDVVRTAMRNRTEKDSGKKLGLAPHVLVVPHELEGLARQENERQYTDSNFTPNRVRFLFGEQSERIIVSPLLSDANDWYVFANKNEAPSVEIGFLQGRQEPEFFLADNPVQGAVFTSDRIRYKVRHEHEAVVIDYRGAYKEAVA